MTSFKGNPCKATVMPQITAKGETEYVFCTKKRT